MRVILPFILFLALAGTADAQDNSLPQAGTPDDRIWFIFPDRAASDFSGEWTAEATIRPTERSTVPDQFGRVGSRASFAFGSDTYVEFYLFDYVLSGNG